MFQNEEKSKRQEIKWGWSLQEPDTYPYEKSLHEILQTQLQIVLQEYLQKKSSTTDEEILPAENVAENTAAHAAEYSAVNVAGKYFQQ